MVVHAVLEHRGIPWDKRKMGFVYLLCAENRRRWDVPCLGSTMVVPLPSPPTQPLIAMSCTTSFKGLPASPPCHSLPHPQQLLCFPSCSQWFSLLCTQSPQRFHVFVFSKMLDYHGGNSTNIRFDLVSGIHGCVIRFPWKANVQAPQSFLWLFSRFLSSLRPLFP